MKKPFLFTLVLMMLLSLGNFGFSQGTPAATKPTLIPTQVVPSTPVSSIQPGSNKSAGLKVPLDGSFTQVTFLPDYTGIGGLLSDDGSTAQINPGFSFCLYGTNEPFFYINNNGNVSFDAPLSTYSSYGFPVSGIPCLAPFWADVDTRSTGGGSVWYKMDAHKVIVIWNAVGYYYIHGDKVNTFELIFTDGTDNILAPGNNVAFSYTGMTWTTGDASSGTNGFGGVPATVGVNKGDGIDYALVGRFDHAGTDFDGAGGNADGVGYLSNKYYEFNACGNTVVIPPNVPISDWALVILGIALLGVGTLYIMKR
jgi:hypothetical protein